MCDRILETLGGIGGGIIEIARQMYRPPEPVRRMANQPQSLPEFDTLWDYAQPAETERKFRQILPTAQASNDPSYLAQLLTQIARTQGLQGRFDDAHATLDGVLAILRDNLKLARVRYLLERGRVFNSSGKPAQAMPLFVEAAEMATREKLSRYAIDAVHMMAIVDPDPRKQVEWNLKGIAMAQDDPSQRGWLWSLYNNIAESHALLNENQIALDYILKLIEYQQSRGEVDPYTLKDKARFLRLTGHAEQALSIIEPLAKKDPQDKWFAEELAATRQSLGH
jgi:tetratricopeptide (TPR) repeat protein